MATNRFDKKVVLRASRLEEVIPELTGHPVTGKGRELRTRCHRPDHTDEHPSMRVNVDKQTYFCDPCQAGGDVFTLVQEVRDCAFPEALEFLAERAHVAPECPNANQSKTPPSQTKGGGASPAQGTSEQPNSNSGLTLQAYADAKKLPLEFLRELGVTEFKLNGQDALRTPFFGEDGQEIAVQFRIGLEKGQNGRDNRFRWRKGSKPCAYGQWCLPEARQVGRIVVVEGASDVQTLLLHGIPALGMPSATGRFDEFEKLLEGIDHVDAVIEPDRGGQTQLAGLSYAAFRDRVQLVSLGDAKDPSGLYLKDPARFQENWKAAVDAAPKWSDVDADERKERATRNFQEAHELLDDPHLMNRIRDIISARGYAGDVRPTQIAYVSMTSRLLKRPNNLGFVAQSASGKNYAVDSAKALMPPEALHEIRAGSSRSLIYDDVDVERKVVIFSEADSIPEDGPAASAIRSLVTDNEMAYDTVERNGNRWETRRIRKPGPTGLITTSTESLPPQMSTRTLEVPIRDDPEQTREVLRMQAVAASSRVTLPDISQFLALQRWLADAGLMDVTIPYAGVLAELVPSGAVRMRRDFPQLLTFIKAVALLYQRQRETRDGQIIASIQDYEIARDLLEPIFDAVATEGCTKALRETVEAVHHDEEISISDLAKRLALAKSTTSARVKRAIRSGWLVNEEDRQGHPATLRRGGPLPAHTTALPTPDRVLELFECSGGIRVEEAPHAPFKEF